MTWQPPSDSEPERTGDDRQDPGSTNPPGGPTAPPPDGPSATPPAGEPAPSGERWPAAPEPSPYEPPSYQPPSYQPPPEYPPPGPSAYPPPGYPPPPGVPPGAPGYPGYPAPPRRTNGLAVAAIICSIGGFFTGISAPVGAVLGHMATKQIAQTGEEGEGLAKAAIIIGWAITGLIVLACCVGAIVIFAAAGTF
jgi:hypothetical protein